MRKYIGQTVTIIYVDKANQITQRRVRVIELQGDRVKVYCHTAKAPRLLLASNILAMEPARHAI
ncbi:hypothetical protein EBB07_00675 [Paenibacillaceae bacterium]|nr:hypothetical protein EBB07_00675 [Paenibacillaceae bacterium]